MTAGIAARLAGVRSDYAFAMTDAAIMAASYLLVFVVVREPHGFGLAALLRVLVVAPSIHLVCNAAFGLYGRVWAHAGIDEARHMLLAGSAVVALLAGVSLSLGRVSPALVVLGPTVATFLTGVSRFRARLFAFQRGTRDASGIRVAIIGAGRTGVTLIRDLVDNPTSGYAPVVVVDDNPRLHGRTIRGVPIAGGVSDLRPIVHNLVIQEVVLAVPSAGPDLVRRAADVAVAAGVPLKVIPAFRELVGGISPLRQVREARIEDLLGRNQVVTDLAAVEELVTGQTVLLTGGGGSIGAEIARQVARFAPGQLVLLDHDETHLHEAEARIRDEQGSSCVQVLADIRDPSEMDRVFATYKPSIVFHAAAHKHVPILERHPLEAVRTNVFGTLNVLEAAARYGTDRFVFISTDKAVRPSSVLGASKRLGEQLVAAQGRLHGRYCSVRFGNVLGSRGSVVPTFSRQIAAGGPVTITDPEMTRYFMSVEEAVQLVLQSSVFASDNELFMLEMGAPVKIIDLAKEMIRLSGFTEREIGLAVVGARAGEKRSEELCGPSEELNPTAHPSIARLAIAQIPEPMLKEGLERLGFLTDHRLEAEARAELFALATAADRDGPPDGLADRTIVLPGARDAIDLLESVDTTAATEGGL